MTDRLRGTPAQPGGDMTPRPRRTASGASDRDSDNDAFLAAVRASRDRTHEASEIYAALRSTGRMASVSPLTYRCQSRCALLDVITTPAGDVIVGFPRFKTSPGMTTATSSASGRERNTEDGWGKWKARAAYRMNVSRPSLSCDHLHQVVLEDEGLDCDVRAGHAEVIVRRDGTRYVVQ